MQIATYSEPTLPPLPPAEQQHPYIEDYPFSPTTPLDLQFLSVGSFSGHASYDYDDYLQQGYQLGAQEVEEDLTTGDGAAGEQDPLLSMLAEMAEKDEFAEGFAAGVTAPAGGEEVSETVGGDVWMGGG